MSEPSDSLREQFGDIDVYLFDQLLRRALRPLDVVSGINMRGRSPLAPVDATGQNTRVRTGGRVRGLSVLDPPVHREGRGVRDEAR